MALYYLPFRRLRVKTTMRIYEVAFWHERSTYPTVNCISIAFYYHGESLELAMSANETAILVLVPDQLVVSVHEAMIRSRSAYLNQLFEASAEDARYDGQGRRILTTPYYTSSLHNTYIHYLQGHLVLPPDVRTNQARYKSYAELYVFGEDIRDKAFQNATIDNMVYASREPDRVYPNDEVISIIYAGTPIRSPARQLMVDLRLCDNPYQALASPAKNAELPQEFLADLSFEYSVAYRADPALRYVRQKVEVGVPVVYHHRISAAKRARVAGMETIEEVDEGEGQGDGPSS